MEVDAEAEENRRLEEAKAALEREVSD